LAAPTAAKEIADQQNIANKQNIANQPEKKCNHKNLEAMTSLLLKLVPTFQGRAFALRSMNKVL